MTILVISQENNRSIMQVIVIVNVIVLFFSVIFLFFSFLVFGDGMGTGLFGFVAVLMILQFLRNIGASEER